MNFLIECKIYSENVKFEKCVKRVSKNLEKCVTRLLYYLPMERMKLTEKEKDQIVKRGAEAMSKIIERMSIEMGELEQENKKLKDKIDHIEFDVEAWKKLKVVWEKKEQELQRENEKLNLHIEAKDKAYMDLLADYNYLKARIKKTERAFIKYKEKLEKLEVDLDMVVMNR